MNDSFAYELPAVPQHLLATSRQSVVLADVTTPQSALGPRYCHGGYILGWRALDQEMTAAPAVNWQPMLGCGMPWVFERSLARDCVAVGEPFLRLGVGRLEKSHDGWNQGGGILRQALAWQTQLIRYTLVRYTLVWLRQVRQR